MERQVLVPGPFNPRLQQHLPPALYSRLLREGSLPAYLLAQECRRLRRELSAIASCIPHPLVTSQIDRGLPGQIGGRRWHGSLLLADISGLNTLAEELAGLGQQGAEAFTFCLNGLFEGLVEDVHHYSGGLLGAGLLKWCGSRLVAFFDEEILGDQHALHAANAALVMHARMQAYTRIETGVGSFHLGLRTGLHSGEFLAAELGDAEHIELLVAGPAIDVGRAALECAGSGEVVVSPALRLLLAQGTFAERAGGFAQLQYLPVLPPPRSPSYWGWEAGAGTLAELSSIIARIDLLRPCLPYGLPQAYLASDERLVAGGDFAAATVLCARIAPLVPLLELAGNDTRRAAALLNAYYARAQAAIHHYGGAVLSLGVLGADTALIALFGAPTAYEDNALRAVRAAIELQHALAEANDELRIACDERPAPEPATGAAFVALRQHIGISSGTLFAGMLAGIHRREFSAAGRALHTAARLAAAAAAGAIWVDPPTRRAVERLVGLYELAPLPPEGSQGPLAPAAIGSLQERSQAMPSLVQTPLIGREAELHLLTERAAAAQRGTGQVVALIGDAGSGKTRLIEELLQRLEAGGLPFRTYLIECQSYDQRTPYAAIRELLRQLLCLRTDSDRPQIYRGVAERLERHAPASARFLPVLGDLFDLPVEETALTASLTPDQRHERVYDLVLALLRLELRRAPLLLAFDDMHWADATSCELLGRLARDTYTLPLLLLLSYRPNILTDEPWRKGAQHSLLSLGELSPSQSAQLVATLLDAEPPPPLVGLLEQAQGNPFFIEELVASLIEQGLLQREAAGWRLHLLTREVLLPARVERVVAARLERLDPADRELIQAAAVIGRRFSQSLLAALVPQQARLLERLERLERRGLIRRAAHGYIFRHMLLRDVTYGNIPYPQRRELHRRTAARLAEWHDVRSGGQTELLARHTLLGEDWSATFHYHLAAGRQARVRHTNQEAIALFETALSIAPRVLPAPRDEILELHERLGYLYMLQGRHQDALDSFDKALTLCKRGQGNTGTEGLIRLSRHIASVYERSSNYDDAFAWLERALAMAGDEPGNELTRCLLLGAGIHYRQGRYVQAREWAGRGIGLAEKLRSVRDQAHAYKLLAAICGNLGEAGQAVELAQRSLQLYGEVQDLQGQAGSHINLGIFFHDLGRWSAARAQFEAAAELTAIIGNVHEQAMVANNLGDVLRCLGDLDGAAAQFQIAQRGWQRSLFGSGVVAMNLGAVYLQRGELELAEEQLARSSALFTEAGTEGFLPELLRYRAELALAQGAPDEAKELCAMSLDHAQRMGARLEEGATRRVLGKALAAQGDLASAEAALRAGLVALLEADSRYELARIRLELADLLPRLGRHDEGLAALRQASETFTALGARLDLEHARAVAARGGYGQ